MLALSLTELVAESVELPVGEGEGEFVAVAELVAVVQTPDTLLHVAMLPA